MNYHDDPDNRGVMVRVWTIDLVDGDHAAALLLNQLLWWHQPGLDGQPRARHERGGHRWLLRADDHWHEECRLTTKQVRRIRSLLVAKGLIEHKRFKLNGAPTSAWRPLYDQLRAIRPNPELPPEGQFHGSYPDGAVGSDPRGAVPIPLRSKEESKRGTQRRRKADFPEEFRLSAEMREWAAREVPTVPVVFETKKFANYWRGRGEQRADWVATWRNWMLNAFERLPNPRSASPPRPFTNTPQFDTEEEFEAWQANQKSRSAPERQTIS